MGKLLIYAGLALALVLTPALADERTGGWRLAHESSPYLQLHADNPVEWFPWGDAAFEKARRENRPLFISVGYFTCHWCHVMERESFDDPGIARLLNEHFVAIKIDREQRPDIDNAYMSYVTMTSGRGGWPMSVWATPDGEPFFGGTYYPPDDVAGRPGFRQLLQRIAALWVSEERDIRDTAEHAVRRLQAVSQSAAPLQQLTVEPLAAARATYTREFDDLQGGFGPAPKFPQPARLLFLLSDETPAGRDMVLFTLDQMLAGGIHDQLGGGFHRYATDFEWRVPHFEKMLYDQALIGRALLEAAKRTDDPRYAQAARRLLDFVLSEMRDAGGGFYSALAADSLVTAKPDAESIEGAGYTWTWDQLTATLGNGVLRDWAAARYDLRAQGNALHDPLGELDGRNILLQSLGVTELMQRFDVDAGTAQARNREVDARLLKARQQRPAVPVDDKIITAWNGYMITTLAQAGRQLEEPAYIDAAARAAAFLLEHLYDAKSGTVYRDWRQGALGVAGFQEDYAALAEALLMLYRVSGKRDWLVRARAIVDRQLELFWDPAHGGFFHAPAGGRLWTREKPLRDGALVSGNTVGIGVLQQLAQLGAGEHYHQHACQALAWTLAQMADYPDEIPYALRGLKRATASCDRTEGS